MLSRNLKVYSKRDPFLDKSKTLSTLKSSSLHELPEVVIAVIAILHLIQGQRTCNDQRPAAKNQQKNPEVFEMMGVPLTVYPWYLLCSLEILGGYNP